MAFSTIELDGFGLFAACDGITDSAGGTWAELGGGACTYEVTNPYVGAGSIGHEYASKSGFGYFQSSSILDFTPGTGAQAGELIYPIISIASSTAFDTLANNGFSFVVGTDTSSYRTYKLVGNDANNGWSSGWKAFAIDPTQPGSIADVGTFDLANIQMIGLWMDTIVSVRAPTIFIDYVTVAKGIKVTGTGTLRELINHCTDTTLRAWPILQEREDIAYCYGKITAGDNVNAAVNTVFTDDGEVVKFSKTEFYHDTNGWSLTHPSTLNQVTAEKHASYTTSYVTENTNLLGDSLANIGMSNDIGAIIDASGGQFKLLGPVIMNSDQTIKNAVLTDCSTRSINGGTFDNNTVNSSDTITASATGSFTGNTINKSVGAASVVAADLAHAPYNTFISDGSNHAVELTAVTASMNWSGDTTDYEAGVTGSPITPTNTGNEDIYITATSSADITINVAAGASIPSIRVAGTFTGAVNVVAGLVTADWTVSPSITGFEYALYTVTAIGSLEGASEVQHVEATVSDSFSYTYTYSAGVILAVQLLDDGSNDFIENVSYYPLSENSQSFTIGLELDTNN